ncbi:hypothetical protein RMSM_07191 [Rhodopirellula maiorica SM1]|uniref:Uncharacterized protein n=1 Tax=Rhodopirellula maiorica SM1 TaxID=1265738 RepID=M5R8R8_9BACT|nr:hypothetical protein RMSM_07191 [Rhodopirellula maiorica SM1]
MTDEVIHQPPLATGNCIKSTGASVQAANVIHPMIPAYLLRRLDVRPEAFSESVGVF